MTLKGYDIRFKLKTLLIAVTAICLYFCWYNFNAQKRSVDWVRSKKGTVEFDCAPKSSGKYSDSVRNVMSKVFGRSITNCVVSARLINDEIVDLDPLVNFSGLKKLLLYSSGVKSLASLKTLKKLQDLDLRTDSVTELSALSQLSSLKKLQLAGKSISDLSSIAQIKSLEILMIRDTSVSDFEALRGLSKLRFLMIQGNSIDDGQVEHLKQCLPNCVVVSQSGKVVVETWIGE